MAQISSAEVADGWSKRLDHYWEHHLSVSRQLLLMAQALVSEENIGNGVGKVRPDAHLGPLDLYLLLDGHFDDRELRDVCGVSEDEVRWAKVGDTNIPFVPNGSDFPNCDTVLDQNMG